MSKSKISWTTRTWNPTTGCDPITSGCKFCYAKPIALNLQKEGNHAYRNGFKVTCQPSRLLSPYRWPPSLVFVNSMSDLFHSDIPKDYRKEIFKVMNLCPQHEFQILTKRSKNLVELSEGLNWAKNIWMGVSVENEDYRYRIDDLRTVDAKVRFLSIEPLIGEIKDLDLSGIHWVIVGGESGPKTRPMKKEWVERIQSICKEQNVRFFLKQWGKIQNNPDWHSDLTVSRSHPYHEKGGRMLNGKIYNAMPVGKEFVSSYLGNKKAA